MDGNHPKNKGTHPRRAKAKDNPYTIYTTGSDNDHPKYILEFTDGQKRPLRLEIDQALYELFDQFELEDKRFLNEVDRHYEHIDLTEAEIEHGQPSRRNLWKKKSAGCSSTRNYIRELHS